MLKGACKLRSADDCKNIYIKPNETKKQREQYQKLRKEVEEIKRNQTNPNEKYPIIRNNRIIFLEGRKNQSIQNQQPKPTIQIGKAEASTRTRRNSKNVPSQNKTLPMNH